MAAVQKLGQLLATKYQGYDANGHYNKVHEDLMLPFDEFLALNGCEAARDLWINPFTAFGYGHFDYNWRWFDYFTGLAGEPMQAGLEALGVRKRTILF